jgi:hypothetical protein
MAHDWTAHERDQENAAIGEWLIVTIAKDLGIDLDDRTQIIERINREIYKAYSAGLSVKFDERGIVVHSIVEGSDAEFSRRVDLSGLLDLDQEDGEHELLRRFNDACAEVDELAGDAWDEIHNYPGDRDE